MFTRRSLLLIFATVCLLFAHTRPPYQYASSAAGAQNKPDNTFRTIHVFVALCDNKHQGIVPVPASLGNGQEPDANLYWGARYGVRTYFLQSKEWKLVAKLRPDNVVLERLVFKHIHKNYYLIADAYDGRHIRECIEKFLSSAHGMLKDTVTIGHQSLGVCGSASLLAYIGHDGLMDFTLDKSFIQRDTSRRDLIVLACYSKHYFGNFLNNARVQPLVWTTGLMSPEAYTLHDAISGYIAGESPQQIRARAARAYAAYQRCSVRAATNLLVSGW
ncbi:MAG: hypothetical protein NZM35_01385 [Chitinophagales bacterium]|nr:hypothetical protein [Chitinophagales bacterium]MDW8419365.1 hypothetical protein [Chitinophagales bacterium]